MVVQDTCSPAQYLRPYQQRPTLPASQKLPASKHLSRLAGRSGLQQVDLLLDGTTKRLTGSPTLHYNVPELSSRWASVSFQ